MSDHPLSDWLNERDEELDSPAPGPASPLDAPASRQAASPLDGHGPDEADWQRLRRDREQGWEFPGEDDDSAGRRLLLLAAAACLTVALLAVVVVVVGADPAADDRLGDGPDLDADRGGSTPAAEATAPGPDNAGPGGEAERLVAAGAALTVRLAASGPVGTHDPAAGADQGGGEAGLRYVDNAVTESVRWLDGLAVASVTAVVLEGDAEAWRAARRVRYAVPMHADGSPAGPPWPLGEVESTPTSPPWSPVADDDLSAAATAVLTDAGYAPEGEVGIARSDSAPGVLRARFTGRAPDAGVVESFEVWLDAQATTVLGGPGPDAGDQR